jgi:hypothetical protein
MGVISLMTCSVPFDAPPSCMHLKLLPPLLLHSGGSSERREQSRRPDILPGTCCDAIFRDKIGANSKWREVQTPVSGDNVKQ